MKPWIPTLHMRILLFGKNGQVGTALEPRLQHLGSVVSLGRSDLELTDIDSIGQCIADLIPLECNLSDDK